jgi:hypothetical protein
MIGMRARQHDQHRAEQDRRLSELDETGSISPSSIIGPIHEAADDEQ